LQCRKSHSVTLIGVAYVTAYLATSLKFHMSISAVTIYIRLYRDLITSELKNFGEY